MDLQTRVSSLVAHQSTIEWVWSTDGRDLAYVTDTVRLRRADGSHDESVGERPNGILHAAHSDGRLIFNGGFCLATADPNWSKCRTNTLLDPDSRAVIRIQQLGDIVSLSPDGKLALLVKTIGSEIVPGSPKPLYASEILDIASGASVPLTFEDRDTYPSAWIPDGNSVLIEVTSPLAPFVTPQCEVWEISTSDPTDRKRLGDMCRPVLSRDGSHLYHTRHEGQVGTPSHRRDILRFDIVTGTDTPIIQGLSAEDEFDVWEPSQ
jgi:dipeptidyl aminopeptidase/acylaminoacyl peptidase